MIQTFGFIPNLDEMTLGEYIDLDTYFGDWDNMHKAMSVLYRPITKEKGNLYNIEEYDGTKYSDVLKLMPLDVVLGSIFFFYNLSSELFDNYPELFDGGNREQLDYSAERSFGEKWSWYQSIYGLSQGDITKFNKVTKMKVNECLMYLSFEKEKSELEKKLIRNK